MLDIAPLTHVFPIKLHHDQREFTPLQKFSINISALLQYF